MGTHFKDPLVWLHGLIAAFLGGGASAVSAAFAANMIAPGQFDLTYNWGNTLKLMAATFVISGALSTFQKLSKSPLPEIVEEDTKQLTKP